MVKYKVPLGVRDYLNTQIDIKNYIEKTLSGVFKQNGFRKIQTPILEYFDLFTTTNDIIDQEKLFRFQDSNGQLLALRPDITSGIARVVSTKLNNISIEKLYYRGAAFTFKNKGSELREYTQTGVEIYGASSIDFDVEIILLAIKSLLKLNIDNFKIEIGDVSIIKGLFERFDFSKQLKQTLIELINKKDAIEIKNIVDELDIDKNSKEFLVKLPEMFGGVETLKLARKYLASKYRDPINKLEIIYNSIKDLGYEKYISLDISANSSYKYYTGLVFKGITPYYGTSILSGGRYDKLCQNSFQKDIKAVGFAIGVDYLVDIYKIANIEFRNEIKYIYIGSCVKHKIIDAKINELQSKGYTTFLTHINCKREFEKFLKTIKRENAEFIFFDEKDIDVLKRNSNEKI